jgi:hypothetical protein
MPNDKNDPLLSPNQSEEVMSDEIDQLTTSNVLFISLSVLALPHLQIFTKIKLKED